MKKILALLVLLLPLDQAHGLRCGRDLVSEGDLKFEVYAKCGDPADIQERVEHRLIRIRTGDDLKVTHEELIPVHVEEWIYNFGPHRLMQWLLFEDGRLKDIRSLDYGYRAK